MAQGPMKSKTAESGPTPCSAKPKPDGQKDSKVRVGKRGLAKGGAKES